MPDNYQIIKVKESGWGALYTPRKPKNLSKEGLRVAVFASCDCGNLLINDLAKYEECYPNLLNLVGIVTDDPVDPDARVSKHKRIWSQYNPAEQSALFQKIIGTSVSLGLSCYSGAVKTDYFRKLYHEWAPEAVMMFCFGQKLDEAIYNYPSMGCYNFHPSDLPKKIGAGTQPFQNAMKAGRRTSPMVIHGVTELIDIGPIIGVSTPVNICLADGSYPVSILTLLDKITSIGGWMGVELADRLVRRKESGSNGLIDPIDFPRILPNEVKSILCSPAVNDLTEKYPVPAHPLIAQ